MTPEQEPVPAPRRYGRASAIAVVWLVAGGLYLALPPGVDQFNHAYMGWRWLRGEVPYRDLIDMNWPAVMGFHALASALFGTRSWSWHAFDFLLLAGSAPFLFGLVRRGFGQPAAWIVLLLYPVLYLTLPHDFSGEHDMSGTQFLLGALWFHVRAIEERCWKRSLAAGAFLGLAMLNKPTLGVLGPLLLLHALLLRMPLKSTIVHIAAAAASSVAVILLGFGVVLAAGASAGEVLDGAIRYNTSAQLVDTLPQGVVFSRWAAIHFKWWPVTFGAAAAAAAWAMRAPQRTPASTALPVLWLAGALSYLAQRKGYAYHLSPCFAAIVGLSAAAIPLAGKAASGRWGPKGMLRAQGVAAVLIFGFSAYKIGGLHRFVPRAIVTGDWSPHEARFPGGEDFTFAQIRELAADVDRSVGQDETVLVVGYVSAVNLLSRRPQPTRFYYTWVLYWMDPSMPMADRWTELWRRDLQERRPRWCLIPRAHFTPWMSSDSGPGRVLREFLEAGYVRTRQIGVVDYGFDLYVRR